MDLGCTPDAGLLESRAAGDPARRRRPGMIMAFTLSLDDFVISYFTSGNGFETLPIRIYSMTKKTVTPKMYALATIIFFVILLAAAHQQPRGRRGPSAQRKASVGRCQEARPPQAQRQEAQVPV